MKCVNELKENEKSQKKEKRPDSQMLTNNKHILIDVQITNPFCPSHVEGAASYRSVRRL